MTKIYTLHGAAESGLTSVTPDTGTAYNESRSADARVVNPGTDVIDIIVTDQSYITSQEDTLRVAQFKTVDDPFRFPTEDYQVCKYAGRQYINQNGLSITWEVGKERQWVYVSGVKYDLAGRIPSGATIRAACGTSESDISVLFKDADGTFSVADIVLDTKLLSIAEYSELDIPISRTVNVGRDELDVKQLASFFIDSTLIISVELRAAQTTIDRYDFDGSQWLKTTFDTLTTITADGNLAFTRLDPVQNVFNSGDGLTNIEQFSTVTSTKQDITDEVVLTGQRIVACNNLYNQFALLVEEVDTTCTVRVDRPSYGCSEYLFQYFHPIIVMGFTVGHAYDWRVGLTAYDSGILDETWTRHSAPRYRRILYTVRNLEADEPFTKSTGSEWSGGVFDSETGFYDRYVGKAYNTNIINAPFPLDIASLAAGLKAAEGNENGYRYYRYWDNTIRLYSADPVNDYYLYERFNGLMELDFINTSGVTALRTDPLHNVSGTVDLVVRANGVETVLATRSIEERVGQGSLTERLDVNFEPLMVYYTQAQPRAVGEVRDYVAAEVVSINKSINISFSGRYSAIDMDKSGFAINLKSDFDKPDYDYPTLSTDERLAYYSEGSIIFESGSRLVKRPFAEAWQAGITKDGSATPDTPPEFDPDDYYDLNFRIFEDRNRLVQHTNESSDAVEVDEVNLPIEWPDIRGWMDFRNRAGFGDWQDLDMNIFYDTSGLNAVQLSNDKTPPPMALMVEKL